MTDARRQSPWRSELDDILRGVAGAFLFGVPFLYTMEVWWKGSFTSPPRMLITLAVAYATLVLLEFNGGFRDKHSHSWKRSLTDSLEALAIAMVTAMLSLILIGVHTVDSGLEAVMGRIAVESLPFSIGVGIAHNVLAAPEPRNGASGGNRDESPEQGARSRHWQGTLADLGATALGAVIIAAAIAPTDEVPMIASMLSPGRLLALVAASLLVSYIIVFEADFGAQTERRSHSGLFQSPISETLVAYVIALLVSMFMLWMFQLIRLEDPFDQIVGYTVILGFPAAIGGAAGRLAL